MQVKSERAKELDALISSKSIQEVGEWPLEIGGNVKRHKFYRFPISMLKFNVNNGRLAMEIREWETENERKLDANDLEDAKVVRELLLSIDVSDTNLLEKDLHQKSQVEPGVITYDGFVINGNRRMAILQKLHDAESTGKWSTLDAIRLPEKISEQDLWRIEAGLQLSKDKIAEYHPVNELLKIQEGLDAGLSPKEVAAAMYGRTINEIELAHERLILINGFLEFWGEKQKKNYGLIKKFGLHEHFIDIQKTILNPAQRQNLPKRQIQERLIKAFALLKAGTSYQSKKKKKGITHWDIRELGKVYADSHAEYEFSKPFAPFLKDLKKLSTMDPELILESFQSARDVLTNQGDRDKPIVLIERATKALKSIDRTNKHLGDERVRSAFKTLNEVINDLAKSIEKH
jgi:hypothetical protein